jgi:hypothetical protein
MSTRRSQQSSSLPIRGPQSVRVLAVGPLVKPPRNMLREERIAQGRPAAATWPDRAGVSPKGAATLMGHKTPEYQPGAASITLRRYVHTLRGEPSGRVTSSASS